MPALNFNDADRKLTSATIATTPTRTPPAYHLFAAASVTPVEITSATPLPLRFPVPGAVLLPVRANDGDCDDGSANGIGTSKVPPGHGGTPPGQAKKTCGTSTAVASTSSTTTPTDTITTAQSPAPTPSPTSTVANPSIATSPEVNTSQPSQGSSPTSANDTRSATLTDGGQIPSNTQSSNRQETTLGLGSTTKLSSPGSSPSDPLFASSDPTADPSTPLPSTPPTLTEPSSLSSSSPATLTPASGSALSAGSAVGIALGVFAATALLVAGALVLFLSIRKHRQRRRGRRNSASAASTASTMMEKRKLRAGSGASEGPPSFRGPLSSTWSWFGTLPIGSASASDSEAGPSEYKYGYGDTYAASTHTRDDAFHGADTEKCEDEGTSIGDGGSRAYTPVTPRAASLDADASGPLGDVEREREEGKTHRSACSLPLHAAPARERVAEDFDVDAPVPETVGRAQTQGELRDPFADPRASGMSRVRRWIETGHDADATVEAL